MHSAVSQSEDAVPRRREGGAGAKRAGRLGRMSAKVLQMVPGMGEEARRQKAEKKEEVYQEILTRTAWDEMHLEDPMDLFWLGRPALVLWMMKFVFFENSLSIALLIHLAWTGDGESTPSAGLSALSPLSLYSSAAHPRPLEAVPIRPI